MTSPPTPQVEATLREAQQALDRADWVAAARGLEEAAELSRTAGDGTGAARLLQMAATLHRASGDTGRSIAAAAGATRAGGEDLRAVFAGHAESGEALAAARRFDEAVIAYTHAIEVGRQLALPAWAESTLRRRRADALAGAGRSADAWSGYDEAARLVEAEPGATAAWVHLEHANRALQAGEHAHALAVADRPGLVSHAAVDAHLRSERLLLLARASASAGDHRGAAATAEAARAAALEAVAPLSYFAAAALLAQEAEETGDRLAAYTALATAWVTLGDLLGMEVAGSWVAPLLEACRLRWGSAAFAAVKAEHDERRRRARSGAGG